MSKAASTYSPSFSIIIEALLKKDNHIYLKSTKNLKIGVFIKTKYRYWASRERGVYASIPTFLSIEGDSEAFLRYTKLFNRNFIKNPMQINGGNHAAVFYF